MTNVKIKLEGGRMPQKATPRDAAYDLYVPNDYVLKEGRQVIDLMFSIELPKDHAATIQPRSGFSINGIEVRYCKKNEKGVFKIINDKYYLDADVIRGLVDEKFRGHVGVILKVHRPIAPNERFVIAEGTRIAQMQIIKSPKVELKEVDELDMTNDRGGGYGHTGA